MNYNTPNNELVFSQHRVLTLNKVKELLVQAWEADKDLLVTPPTDLAVVSLKKPLPFQVTRTKQHGIDDCHDLISIYFIIK